MIVLFLFICLFALLLGTLYLVSSDFKKNLEKFEQWLSRNRDETMKIGSKNSIYAKFALYGVFLSMLLVGIYPLINQQIVESKLGSATIDIGDDFKVKYEDSPKCDFGPCFSKYAFFNFDLSKLQSNKDKDHRATVSKSEYFWLFKEVKKTDLIEANKISPLYLLLGYFSAEYEIYINGKLDYKGVYKYQSAPIVLQIDKDLIKDKFFLAIRFHNNLSSKYPDYFTGGEKIGFADYVNAAIFADKMMFESKTRPWIAFSLFFFISLLFFFFWSSAPRKQEYAYLAFFSLVEAMIQLTYIDSVYRNWSFRVTNSVDIILIFYEAILTLFLALSFGRARRAIFYLLPFLILFPFIFLATLGFDTSKIFSSTEFLTKYISIPIMAFGVLYLFLQISLIIINGKIASAKGRLIRLSFFTAAYLLYYLIYYNSVMNEVFTSSTYYGVFNRLVHIGIVTVMGIIIMIDYRKQEKFFDNIFVSTYHKNNNLIPVEGALLKIDLKDSSILRKLSIDLYQDPESIISEIRDRFFEVAHKYNAIILSTPKGDDADIFFPKQGSSDKHLLDSIDAFYEIHEKLYLFHIRQIKNEGIEIDQYAIRAALRTGTIEPTWLNQGGTMIPIWKSLDKKENVFEILARYHEVEKKHDNLFAKSKSYLLVGSDEFQLFSKKGRWSEEQVLSDDHGNSYNIKYISI